MTSTILQILDDIDVAVDVSAASVMESCLNCYIKAFDLESNSSNPEVFQESKGILDQVKQDAKNDKNKIVTILKFIPRLIKAIAKTLSDKFKKSNVGDAFKEASEKLSNMAPETKQAKVKEINKRFNGKGECYIAEDGKIKFKRRPGDIVEKFSLFAGLGMNSYHLFERMRERLDFSEPDTVRTFIKECDDIIKGNKERDNVELYAKGFDAVKDILKDLTTASAEIALTAESVKEMSDEFILHNDMKKNPSSSQDKLFESIKTLTDKVGKISAIITAGIGSTSLFMDFGEIVKDVTVDAKELGESLERFWEEHIIDTVCQEELYKGLKYPYEWDKNQEKRKYTCKAPSDILATDASGNVLKYPDGTAINLTQLDRNERVKRNDFFKWRNGVTDDEYDAFVNKYDTVEHFSKWYLDKYKTPVPKKVMKIYIKMKKREEKELAKQNAKNNSENTTNPPDDNSEGAKK